MLTQFLAGAALLLAVNCTPTALQRTHIASHQTFDSRASIQEQSIGHWLPRNRSTIQQWVANQVDVAHQTHNGTLIAPLQRFRETIRQDPLLSRLADAMFIEVPNKAPYNADPTGASEVRDFDHFLTLLDSVLQQGPQWFDRNQPSTAMALIGTPISALLAWPMGTVSGYEFFLSPKVNAGLREVLQYWGSFLATPASAGCLDGWLSEDAKKNVAEAANAGKTNYTFEQLFNLPNASAPHLGFRSWDEYFVRSFQNGRRPVASPDNDSVITNACESAPLQLKHNVSSFDSFYLKGQPYSLENMLNGNPLASKFAGGTVYQAFLSALSYHRWHAPVSGKVVGLEVVPGTYFSENYFEGVAANPQAPDPAGPDFSQPYISSVATRGIVYIQAKNPKIGLMAVVMIGMAEVSSCEFTIKEGDELKKGDEIGMFRFGGSTHTLVFRPGVELEFLPKLPRDQNSAVISEPNQMVKSALAVVK